MSGYYQYQTGTSTISVNGIYWDGSVPGTNGQQIQIQYVPYWTPPNEEEKKMSDWVVEKATKDGAERKRLSVQVNLDGGTILSESESKQLAELVCKLLGLKFVGKA